MSVSHQNTKINILEAPDFFLSRISKKEDSVDLSLDAWTIVKVILAEDICWFNSVDLFFQDLFFHAQAISSYKSWE